MVKAREDYKVPRNMKKKGLEFCVSLNWRNRLVFRPEYLKIPLPSVYYRHSKKTISGLRVCIFPTGIHEELSNDEISSAFKQQIFQYAAKVDDQQ